MILIETTYLVSGDTFLVMLYDVTEESKGTVESVSPSFEDRCTRMCFTSATLLEYMGSIRRLGYDHWMNIDELVTNMRGTPTSVRLDISIGVKK